MSKRRDEHGQFERNHSFGFILLHWIGGLLGLGAMYGIGRFLASNLAAFRSCDHNNTGLTVASCGKQGLDAGDFLSIVLLLVALAITIRLFSQAWHMSRKSSL